MAAPPLPVPPLTWLRSFEAAARRLNFTEAGKELGLTQAAVSQQIRLLEETLGAKLFRRLRRGVQLTSEGAAYLPHVQAGFAILARSTRELFEPAGRGTVTLRSPISFACLWLLPRLSGLAKDRPDLNVDVITIHVPEDYGRPANFDIRFGRLPFPGRIAVRLTEERLVPVASPRISSTSGKDAWTTLPRLSLSGGREMWSQWFAFAGLAPDTGPTHRFDTFIAAMAAARAGAGVLLGSRPLVDGALAAGELERLSERELPSASGHFLTYADDARLSPTALDFLSWIESAALHEHDATEARRKVSSRPAPQPSR